MIGIADRPARWPLVAVPVAYAVLSVLITRSWWAPLGGRVTALNEPDAVLFSWLLTATPHALADGRLPLYSDLLNHPAGINLMWNNGMALPALLFAPLTLTIGGLATVTVLTALGLAGTASSTFWCLRAAGVRALAAAPGGLLAGFSPAMVAQAAGAHPNLVLNVLAPVLVLLAVRLMVDPAPRHRTAVLLGVVAGAQVLVGEETLFLAGVVVAGFLVVLVASYPRAALTRARVFGVRALLALGTFLLVGGPALAYQLFGPLPQEGSPFRAAYYSADLAGFVVGTPLQATTSEVAATRSATFAGGLEEHTALLGWPLLALCTLVFVRYRRDARVRTTLLVALTTGVASLGPVLTVDGVPTGVALPWTLVDGLPGFEHVLTSRFALYTAGLVGAGLAFALHRALAEPAVVRVAGLAAVAVALVPLVPVALQGRDAPAVPEFFTAPAVGVADCPGSVLVLPFPAPTATDAMAWQQAAGMSFAMPGGYFIGPADDGRAYVGGQPTRTGRLFEEVRRDGEVQQPTPAMRAAFRADLARWSACAVVLGPNEQGAVLQEQASALIGAEPVVVGGVALWRDLSDVPG